MGVHDLPVVAVAPEHVGGDHEHVMVGVEAINGSGAPALNASNAALTVSGMGVVVVLDIEAAPVSMGSVGA